MKIYRRFVLFTALAILYPSFGNAVSTDNAGNTLIPYVSAGGSVSADSSGNNMFFLTAGPAFLHGLDNTNNQVFPLSPDYFVVPVQISAFTIE